MEEWFDCDAPQAAFLLLLKIAPFLFAILTLTACSTASRHRTIVYDQQWSTAASVKNLSCVPELRESCEKRAREEEAAYSKALSAAFRASPKCATVQFLIASGNDRNSEELERRLADNVGFQYWRLRVDFRPGLTMQPFVLGSGKKSPVFGGDDAEESAAHICEAAKNNGVTAIW